MSSTNLCGFLVIKTKNLGHTQGKVFKSTNCCLLYIKHGVIP